MSGPHGIFCSCKRCHKKYSQIGSMLPDSGGRRKKRPVDKEVYGKPDYGQSSYARTGRTFDGYPSISKRRDDGKIDIIYGPEPLDLNNPLHGHAVIKNES
jgi:hypothetical protein